MDLKVTREQIEGIRMCSMVLGAGYNTVDSLHKAVGKTEDARIGSIVDYLAGYLESYGVRKSICIKACRDWVRTYSRFIFRLFTLLLC
jgi:hypothetical protein